MSQLQDNLDEIKRQKDLYLLPGNIRKDLTILGITGTFEGGGSSEGIKIFDTISNMNNSTGNVDGDLAIVYNQTTNNYQGIFEYGENIWNIAPTGLTASSKEVLNPLIFQGKNGVETGTLNINTNISKDDLKFKSEVYGRMSILSLDSSITNISNLFANRLDLINIPSINLDNITNMENTFYNCNNLSESSYITITNILPNASNLSNQYLSNIGLNINKFTSEQINILNTKGYIDAIPVEPVGKLTYYTVSMDNRISKEEYDSTYTWGGSDVPDEDEDE